MTWLQMQYLMFVLRRTPFVSAGLGCALGKQAGQITFGNMLGVLWFDQKNRPEMVSTVVQEAGVTQFAVWFVSFPSWHWGFEMGDEKKQTYTVKHFTWTVTMDSNDLHKV